MCVGVDCSQKVSRTQGPSILGRIRAVEEATLQAEMFVPTSVGPGPGFQVEIETRFAAQAKKL